MNKGTLSTAQMITVVALRVLIGWHFLYEGLSKLTSDGWSGRASSFRPAGRRRRSSGGWPRTRRGWIS